MPSLLALLASRHEVVAVVTRPDARGGRGRTLAPSPVKEVALEHGLEVLTPADTARPRLPRAARASSRPTAARSSPTARSCRGRRSTCRRTAGSTCTSRCCPAWRGAAPVQRAVMAGDEVTGRHDLRPRGGPRHRAGARHAHRDGAPRRHRRHPARPARPRRRRAARRDDGRPRGRLAARRAAAARRRQPRAQAHHRRGAACAGGCRRTSSTATCAAARRPRARGRRCAASGSRSGRCGCRPPPPAVRRPVRPTRPALAPGRAARDQARRARRHRVGARRAAARCARTARSRWRRPTGPAASASRRETASMAERDHDRRRPAVGRPARPAAGAAPTAPSERTRRAEPTRFAAYTLLRAVADGAYANLELPGDPAPAPPRGPRRGLRDRARLRHDPLAGLLRRGHRQAAGRPTDPHRPQVLDVLRLGRPPAARHAGRHPRRGRPDRGAGEGRRGRGRRRLRQRGDAPDQRADARGVAGRRRARGWREPRPSPCGTATPSGSSPPCGPRCSATAGPRPRPSTPSSRPCSRPTTTRRGCTSSPGPA